MNRKTRTYLTLFLTVMLAMSLAGCSQFGKTNDSEPLEHITIDTSKDKEIALSTKNYNEYLDVHLYCMDGGNSVTLQEPLVLEEEYETSIAYPELYGFLTIANSTTDIVFQDVMIKAKIAGTYQAFNIDNPSESKTETFEFIFETSVSSVGTGSATLSHQVPDGYATLMGTAEYQCDVIEITGKAIQ